MSVATTTRKQQFTLDGSTSGFTFVFRALPDYPEYIKCIATVSGADTQLDYTTDFTVAVNADGVGGTVTLVSPSAVGSGTLTVYRETDNIQGSDYDDYNRFPADTVEQDFDIRTMVAQELSETLDRAIKVPISSTTSTDLPEPDAGKFLGWNSDETGLTNYTITSGSLGLATQAQAAAGTNNTEYMTPLRTSQWTSSTQCTLTLGQLRVASQAVGDLPYADSTTSFTRLGIGSNNQVLTVTGGTTLVWAAAYTPSADNALSGSVVQVGRSQDSSEDTSITVLPVDDTTPSATEGEEYSQLAITMSPRNASNTLLFELLLYVSHSSGQSIGATILQGSTVLCAGSCINTVGYTESRIRISYSKTAGTTASTVFHVRYGPTSSGTVTTNTISGSPVFNGLMYSSLTITEIKA